MKAGRATRTSPHPSMVAVSHLASELGLSEAEAVTILNHLGASAVKHGYDAINSDVADRARRLVNSGHLATLRDRFATLSSVSRDRALTGDEFDDLLALASVFDASRGHRVTMLLRPVSETPPNAQPLFSSREIPVVAQQSTPAAVFSSQSRPAAAEPAARVTPPPQPQTPPKKQARAATPPPAQRSTFPRRTCNLCNQDFCSDAPSHGCAYDLRMRSQAAEAAGLPPVTSVAPKRVRPGRPVPIDEDRPRGRGWIVPSGHPGSGRRR